MKIIAQGKNKKKEKEGGAKMKKLIVIAILVGMVLAVTNNAFAYWKTPVGIDVQDPTIIQAVERASRLW